MMNFLKKSIFLLFIYFFFIFCIHAQQQENNNQNNQTEQNEERLTIETGTNAPLYLSNEQTKYTRNNLKDGEGAGEGSSDSNKKKKRKKRYKKRVGGGLLQPWGAFLINLFLPIGLGSYILGDYSAGFVQTMLLATGVAFFVTAYYALPIEVEGDANSRFRGFRTVNLFFNDIFNYFNRNPLQYSFYLLSMITFFTSWLVGIISPWTFYSRQRKKILARKRRIKKQVRRQRSSLIESHNLHYVGTRYDVNKMLLENNRYSRNFSIARNDFTFPLTVYSKDF